jgi:hypothetical protein
MKPKNVLLRKSRLTVSKKCKAYSVSKLGLAAPDNRKAFYAGWDAAIEQALTPGEPVAWMHTGGHIQVRNPGWPPETAALYTAPKGWTPLYTAPQPQPKQEPREHITDGSPCWCNPEVDYIDPETGAAVIVHRRPQ